MDDQPGGQAIGAGAGSDGKGSSGWQSEFDESLATILLSMEKGNLKFEMPLDVHLVGLVIWERSSDSIW